MSRAETDIDIESAVSELSSLQDLVRWGVSRFSAAELFYGHGTDNAIDETMQLVLHALRLPRNLPAGFMTSRLTAAERRAVVDLLVRRIVERRPAAYLIGEAWFAGMSFYVDERVVIPRSPVAELIGHGFEPWLAGHPVKRVLDLCTGSGCIAVACAEVFEGARVDAADISAGALEVAARNVGRYGLESRIRLLHGDLYAAVPDGLYDLIVSNPPYVSTTEWEALPAEYRYEPQPGLESGDEGLDCVVRILRRAIDYLAPGGILVVEVGYSRAALERHFPEVMFVWPEFEHGGEGVFVMSHDELHEYQPYFSAEQGSR
jgi:ribosomal protein L3 glutamine methyltransferase